MYYEQVYIDTLWQEFQIPPDEKTGGFKISQHHLHIWPKQTYMFIAIPSEVGPWAGFLGMYVGKGLTLVG